MSVSLPDDRLGEQCNSARATADRLVTLLDPGRYSASLVRTASTSISSRTRLPTSKPPVSRTWFQETSQSSRSTSAEAVKLALLPVMGSSHQPRNSTSSVTGRVISLTVRWPTSWKAVPPTGRSSVLLNLTLGNRSTAKKSSLFRWLSRISTPVWMLAASISTSVSESSGFSAIWIVPENEANRPRTLVRIWRATTSTLVCAGSSSQIPVGGNATLSTSRARVLMALPSYAGATDGPAVRCGCALGESFACLSRED